MRKGTGGLVLTGRFPANAIIINYNTCLYLCFWFNVFKWRGEHFKHIYNLFGKRPVTIGAQLYLKKFYESFGFVQSSEVYIEDGIPHIEMTRREWTRKSSKYKNTNRSHNKKKDCHDLISFFSFLFFACKSNKRNQKI